MNKKIVKTIVIMLLVAVTACCLVACGDKEPINGTMTFVVGGDSPQAYTVNLDEVEVIDGALSVLAYLKEKEGLQYTAETGIYGAFLTKVGSLEQSGGKYIYIYTSVEKDFDVSTYATTVIYEGKTLTSAGVSISELTVTKDCVIYIGLIEY